MAGHFDTTRPRIQYTRPLRGPNPFPGEGAGDPAGERFGGLFSLVAHPIAITMLWVYTDGKSPECTYSVGRLVPSGITSGYSWDKTTRSTDGIVDDSVANFSKQFIAQADPSTLASTSRYLSQRWAAQTVAP